MAANILIVEDEESILELIAINLHQAGFNPVSYTHLTLPTTDRV